MVNLKKVRKDAPWAWLKGGFEDMMKTPVISIGYGLVFTVVGLLITAGLWMVGQGAVAPVLLAGFALVAPVFAVGVYRVNQVRESGLTPRLFDFWTISPDKLTQLALLSVLLLVFFLTWARLAQFIFVVMVSDTTLSVSQFLDYIFNNPAGLSLLVTGTIIGAVLAFVAYLVSALSFPMLTDQNVDAITAVVASVKAVFGQPFVMLTWALLIAFMVMVGMALFGIGLALTFPWIAHASWRAYKDFDPQPDTQMTGAPQAE